MGFGCSTKTTKANRSEWTFVSAPPARYSTQAALIVAQQDGKIYIELINGPFLYREKGTPDEYKAGLDLAIERGWLELDRSGTFVRFTQAGSDLFA